MGRRLDWHCLAEFNILSLNPIITDELLVFHLTSVFASCGIARLRVRMFLDQGRHVIVTFISADDGIDSLVAGF